VQQHNSHSVEDSAPKMENWPAPMGNDAKIGIAQDFVGLVAPHSESDPASLLMQFLVAFGSACGRGPYFSAEADRHGTNLFAVIVGKTNAGRKGTSWGHVLRLFEGAEPTWKARVHSGLSTGEGVIHAVRDRVEKSDDGEIKIVDDGVVDKRLLVVESEFSSVLKVATRQGNTLTDILRCAWDGRRLQTMTRNSPLLATDSHISIIGHITPNELNRLLTDTDAANGFGNRFLWVCAKRSKMLPEGGRPDTRAMAELTGHVAESLRFAQMVGELRRDAAARTVWHEVYGRLTDDRPGLLGAMTARAAPIVMRMATTYALMDMSAEITTDHLRAALAVWDYCEQSASVIFGDRMGDPTADTILASLAQAGEIGMSRTDITNLFTRNVPAPEIERALASLQRHGRAYATSSAIPGRAGRPAQVWKAATL
jgi:Protein of unknown function (DUF3987)